ncbi:MAG: hypothetical protein GF353_11600 [Candidatus Lokiarchaeota archaeon]|nr:hypothetical protein [Candidatus Lokiarchaeota archaeon]
MTKNYEVLKKFFIDTLKITDKRLIYEVYCGIEHHITAEVSNALENFLIVQNEDKSL